MSRVARALACLAPLLLVLFDLPATAQSVPPHARWSAFETQHFDVTYLDGLEDVAQRAAVRAEAAYDVLAREFVAPPAGRIELVITDHVDIANGLASPFPRSRILVFAQPPAGEPSLVYSDDWIETLVLHELVHIFHFDLAGGIWQPLRRVFGREPVLFPQIFSPGWIVEGLAVYFETEYTTTGRARGAIYDMMLRSAVLEDAFFGIDEVTLDPTDWPAGSSRYLYGAMFVDHLARRFGPRAAGELVEHVGDQIIPYRPDAAAKAAFGTTLNREWRAWQDSLQSHYAAVASSIGPAVGTEPAILTDKGWYASHPRFSPDGSRLSYASNTGRRGSVPPGHRYGGVDTGIAPNLGPWPGGVASGFR